MTSESRKLPELRPRPPELRPPETARDPPIPIWASPPLQEFKDPVKVHRRIKEKEKLRDACGPEDNIKKLRIEREIKEDKELLASYLEELQEGLSQAERPQDKYAMYANWSVKRWEKRYCAGLVALQEEVKVADEKKTKELTDNDKEELLEHMKKVKQEGKLGYGRIQDAIKKFNEKFPEGDKDKLKDALQKQEEFRIITNYNIGDLKVKQKKGKKPVQKRTESRKRQAPDAEATQRKAPAQKGTSTGRRPSASDSTTQPAPMQTRTTHSPDQGDKDLNAADALLSLWGERS